MQENRPRWQVHACPEWCDGGHRDDDHLDDRIHARIGVTSPITTVSEAGPVVADLEVAVWRRDGEAQTWLSVGFGSGREFDIAVPDVDRMLASILDVLDARGGDGDTPVVDVATLLAFVSSPRVISGRAE